MGLSTEVLTNRSSLRRPGTLSSGSSYLDGAASAAASITHYLKSTVYCFACERRLLVHKARSKSGRIYDYFVCSGRQNTTRCGQGALRIADVEQRIEDLYVSIEISSAQRERIKRVYHHSFEAGASVRAQELSDFREQREAIELQQTKLIDLYYRDGIPREVLVREQRKLAEALARIITKQGRLEEDGVPPTQRLNETLDLLDGAHARYLAAPPNERKRLNNALLVRVLVGPANEGFRVELLPEIAEILALDDAPRVFA